MNSKPVDLTTLGADAIHPPPDHDIYKHPDIIKSGAPNKSDIARHVMTLQTQIGELRDEIKELKRAAKQSEQSLSQRLMILEARK